MGEKSKILLYNNLCSKTKKLCFQRFPKEQEMEFLKK